jgi:hypothetical protein
MIEVLGMLTGIAGVIIALAAHWRVSNIQKLERKLDASVEYERATRRIDELVSFIDQVANSRRGVLNARGHTGSSVWKTFETQCEADREEVQRLRDRLAGVYPDQFHTMDQKKLLDQLTEIRKVENQISALWDKYATELEKDERDRDNLQADMRADRAARTPRDDIHGS